MSCQRCGRSYSAAARQDKVLADGLPHRIGEKASNMPSGRRRQRSQRLGAGRGRKGKQARVGQLLTGADLRQDALPRWWRPGRRRRAPPASARLAGASVESIAGARLAALRQCASSMITAKRRSARLTTCCQITGNFCRGGNDDLTARFEGLFELAECWSMAATGPPLLKRQRARASAGRARAGQ